MPRLASGTHHSLYFWCHHFSLCLQQHVHSYLVHVCCTLVIGLRMHTDNTDDLFIQLDLSLISPNLFSIIAKYRGFKFKGASCIHCLAHYANEIWESHPLSTHRWVLLSGNSHNSLTSSLTYRESVFLKLRNGRLLSGYLVSYVYKVLLRVKGGKPEGITGSKGRGFWFLV